MAITPQGPNVWKLVWKKDGRVLTTNTLTLSADGKSIGIKSTLMKPDGTTEGAQTAYRRVSGGRSWAGMWESAEVRFSSSDECVISPYQGDGLVRFAIG